jgi:hypothetical protein
VTEKCAAKEQEHGIFLSPSSSLEPRMYRDLSQVATDTDLKNKAVNESFVEVSLD